MFSLGYCYYRGEGGLKRDVVEGYMWMYRAAMVPSTTQIVLDLVRKQIANKLTPTQVEEAERRAREWKPKAEQESKTPPLKTPTRK